MSEVKPVESIKNLQTFLEISLVEKEFLPSLNSKTMYRVIESFQIKGR